jgi:HK97 family phage portal protein
MKLLPFLRSRAAAPVPAPADTIEKAAKVYTLNDLFYSGWPLPWTPGAGGNVYQENVIAYACIKRQATDIAGAPLLFLTDPDDADSDVPPNDPVRMLFRRPAGSISTSQLIQFVVTWTLSRGEAFLIFDNPAAPRMMYGHLDPEFYREDKTPDGSLIRWNVQSGGAMAVVLPTDLVHHKLVNPSNPVRGLSPLHCVMSPDKIVRLGDSLIASMVERGGPPNVYSTDKEMMPKQQEELLSYLMSRRSGGGRSQKDILLANGIKQGQASDADSASFLPEHQKIAEQRICTALGMSPSLIGRDDEPNYATFKGRLRIYWTQTLIPLMHSIESAFDSYFVDGPPRTGIHVRFDLSKIEALQDELSQQVDIATKLVNNGVPWRQANERLNLGIDVDALPMPDDVLVSSVQVPLSLLVQDWESSLTQPQPSQPTPPGKDEAAAEDDPEGGTTPSPGKNAFEDVAKALRAGRSQGDAREPERLATKSASPLHVARARMLDARGQIDRNRRLARMERAVGKSVRLAFSHEKDHAVALIDKWTAEPTRATLMALPALVTALGKERAPKLIEALKAEIVPVHYEAALEGALSVQEIKQGKSFTGEEVELVRKGPSVIGDRAREAIKRRTPLIEGMGKRVFNRLIEDVADAVESGLGDYEIASEIQRLARNGFNTSINRSLTIARTEVGSAYNVSRFEEMKVAGFRKHVWLTAQDELVRGEGENDQFDHVTCDGEVRNIDEPFPCGLAYPMEDGGEAGNTINCRCSSFPVEEE